MKKKIMNTDNNKTSAKKANYGQKILGQIKI